MFKKKLKILSIVLVLMLVFNCCCFAANETEQVVEEQTGEQVTVQENATQEENTEGGEATTPDEATTTGTETEEDSKWEYKDLYLSGDSITLDKVVDGNVFITARNEAIISGEVGGDLFICANKVTIEGGYIYSNLFVLTNELNINGIVYDLYGCASNVKLSENGLVARDFRVSASNVTIEGQINRNAFIDTNEITFGEKGVISGNLNYAAGSEISIPENAVAGEVKYEGAANITSFSANTILKYAFSLIGSLLYTLAVTAIALRTMPSIIEKIKYATKSPKTYLWGLLGLIVAPIVIFILALSSVGIRVSFVVLLLYMLVMALTVPVANIWLGKLIKDRFIKNEKVTLVASILIATVATWILKQIPFVNIVVYLAIIIGGFGIILSMFKCSKNEKE